MDRMVSKVLVRAAKLIDRGWCRGAYAKTATGRSCSGLSRHAARWCVRGAIWAAADRMGQDRRPAFAVVERLVPTELVYWNDTIAKNKRQVAALLRRAAESAEATP